MLSRSPQAVKSGGPSEESNKLLADTIKEARRANVPKDNIARAIKRATDGSQGDYKEAVYEVCPYRGWRFEDFVPSNGG